MRIVPLPRNSLQAGSPTPFSLRDGKGNLVMRRGAVLTSDHEIDGLARHGLWVDVNEADAFVRSGGMARTRAPGHSSVHAPVAIAANQAGTLPVNSTAQAARLAYWQALRERTDRCLREPRAVGFVTQLAALRAELVGQLEHDTDRTLLALVWLASASSERYSATHALLCAAAATLAARQLPGWTVAHCESIGMAALSMDVWMTALQDELATQPGAPTIAQRAVLARHAAGSAELLKDLGVADDDWLEAVAHHHDAVCGPLANRCTSMRMARLLQRAELFAAMISPRDQGPAVSAAAAAQAIYWGEDGKPDEAGMLMIKALGVFPPGCRVRLQQGGTGVVVRRGARANMPVVAVVADAAGQPLAAEDMRATAGTDHAVKAALAPHEAMLSPAFEALLAFGR